MTAWTNAFLQPPPPHILDLLAAATAHQPVADAFAQRVRRPRPLRDPLATPESCAAFADDSTRAVGV